MTTPIWDGQTIDPDLLRSYGYNDQITYDGYTLPRFLYYILAGINEIGGAIDSAASAYFGTSATCVAIGSGTKSFNIGAAKAIVAGQILTFFDAADPTQFLVGVVDSYDSGTGALVLEVAADGFGGTGTICSWNWALTGLRGQRGQDGTPGVPYQFSDSVSGGDPGAGFLAFNAPTPAGSTGIDFSTTADGGALVTNWLGILDDSTSIVKGYLFLGKLADPTSWVLFSINSAGGAGLFRTVGVTYVASSSATPFANGDELGVSFIRNGDKGDLGPPGSGTNIHAAQEGVIETALPRSIINLTGSLVVTDDPGNDRFNISLDGDEASPGPNKIFGTDADGNKGFVDAAGVQRARRFFFGQL